MKELESRLQQAYTHMENGEPPDSQALAEWERMLQDDNRRKQSQIERINVILGGGRASTFRDRTTLTAVYQWHRKLLPPRKFGLEKSFIQMP